MQILNTGTHENIEFKKKWAHCLKGPKQIIRSIVLLTCTVVVIYQIAECMRKIRNPPIATYTHFDFNQTIKYPAVTICRDPPYKPEVLEKYGLYGHPRFTSEWKYFNFEQVNLDDFWQEATFNDKDNFISYGLNKTAENIKIINNLHFILGQCQTLHPTVEMTTASKDTGYSILMNHSMRNIDNTPSAIPPGFHVYIHQIEEPFSELSSIGLMEYLYVNVGEELEVKLNVQQLNMLSNGPKVCHSGQNYSTSRCVEECTWIEILKHVKCSGPWLNMDAPYCKNYTQMKDLIVDYIKLANNPSCSCPQRCRSLSYNAFVVDRNSLIMWNALTGYWTAKTGIHELQTQLYIYFNNKMVSVYEESHSYDWSLFLADFGGSLGFLLGLSVLGVIALLENIFDLVIKPSIDSIRSTRTSTNGSPEQKRNKKISVASDTSGKSTSTENSDTLKDYENYNIKYGNNNYYI